MWIAKVIVVASIAVLAATLPARAKHGESQKTDDKPTTSSCQAYRQAADGTWQKLPCEEAGGSQTPHKPPSKTSDAGPR